MGLWFMNYLDLINDEKRFYEMKIELVLLQILYSCHQGFGMKREKCTRFHVWSILFLIIDEI